MSSGASGAPSADHRVAARAVHPHAARVDERASGRHRVEQRFERGALDRDAVGRVLDRAVDHRVGLRRLRAQHVEVAHLAAHRLGAERAQLPLRGVAARERAHDVRAPPQLAHDARADVTRTARDEDRHYVISSPGAGFGRATMVMMSKTMAASVAAIVAPIAQCTCSPIATNARVAATR